MEREQKMLKIAYRMQGLLVWSAALIFLKAMVEGLLWMRNDYERPDFNFYHIFVYALAIMVFLMLLGYFCGIFVPHRLGRKNLKKGNWKEASAYGETCGIVCMIPDIVLLYELVQFIKGEWDYDLQGWILYLLFFVYRVIILVLFLKCNRMFKAVENHKNTIENGNAVHTYEEALE